MVSTDSIGIFALCYSQWVAYLGFVGIFCYSQCVVCTDPLTLCVLSVGALLNSFISFTCSASGWPGCSQWGLYAVFFGVVFGFPVLDHSVGQHLPCSNPNPRFVCFLVGSTGI